DVARDLRTNAQQWLRLPESPLLLYSQLPEIQTRGDSNLELRFTVPANSAHLLLERLAGTDVPETAVATYYLKMESRRRKPWLCLSVALALMLVSVNANASGPLVDIQSVNPTIVVELRYAGNNNLLKQPLYPQG